jgi:hypothetical protein
VASCDMVGGAWVGGCGINPSVVADCTFGYLSEVIDMQLYYNR